MTVTAEQAKALLDAATPGPWKWFPEEREVCNYGTREWTSGVEEWWCIASFYVNDEEPDARLIAAAPDLAATVVELSAQRDRLDEDLTLANSVIATVEAERDKLARWKAEAMTVLKGWDQVWQAAGRPGAPGESTSAATAKHITALQAAIDKVLAIIAEPFIPSDQIVPGQHWADTNNQRIYKALTQGGEGS